MSAFYIYFPPFFCTCARQKYQRIFFALAIVAFLSSCIAPLAVPEVRIETAQHNLRWEAEILLPIKDDAAQTLQLREQISESVESLAGDGSINAYIVKYQLYFRLDSQTERTISLDQVVSVDEARYLAGRRALISAAGNLRREALHRMRFILAKL